MIIRSAEFVTSARLPAHYPPASGPEIAFAGRSNVGKSSLINTLLNRKHLVKTSSTPGRTQLLNFFNVNNAFLFVDLPGFGYAKVPRMVRRQWAPMIERYLSTRPTLKGVVLILDIRRPPGDVEVRLVPWLMRLGVVPLLVLTKADKLSKTRQNSEPSFSRPKPGRRSGRSDPVFGQNRSGPGSALAATGSPCPGAVFGR